MLLTCVKSTISGADAAVTMTPSLRVRVTESMVTM
jgi:hypothetical protein